MKSHDSSLPPHTIVIPQRSAGIRFSGYPKGNNLNFMKFV
jgi:hypothetical protein